MMHVVIVGGGIAGLAAAMELRKLDKSVGITVLERQKRTGYAPCALPYVIAGGIKKENIFYASKERLDGESIGLITEAEVTKLDRKTRTVFYTYKGKEKTIAYDRLVLATGSKPHDPGIPGLKEWLAFRRLGDAERIMASRGSRAVIIGGGFSGVELSAALKMKVTLLECAENLIPYALDKDTGGMLTEHLSSMGVDVRTGCKIQKASASHVICDGDRLFCDLLVVTSGVKPDVSLALDAGLECGERIAVDDHMRTSDRSVFAIGECAQSRDFYTGGAAVSNSAVTAVRQAGVAASNIAGMRAKMSPPLNATVSVIGGLYLGSVGMTEREARAHGVKAVSALYRGVDKAEYHPEAGDVRVKLIADRKGRVLGGQFLGTSNVAGMVDTLSLAIGKGFTLRDLVNSETCYNPAVANIHHPLTIAAEVCLKKLEHSRR
jgi:NADH oxidase (H2O2-forming)